MKLYILFADEDTGASEDWTIFKTGAEVFDSVEKRENRKKWILENYSGDHPSDVDFYEYEIDLNPKTDSSHPLTDGRDPSDDDEFIEVMPVDDIVTELAAFQLLKNNVNNNNNKGNI